MNLYLMKGLLRRAAAVSAVAAVALLVSHAREVNPDVDKGKIKIAAVAGEPSGSVAALRKQAPARASRFESPKSPDRSATAPVQRAMRKAPASNAKLRGAIIYKGSWYEEYDYDTSKFPYGIYEFSTTEGDADYKPVFIDPKMYVMDAAMTPGGYWTSHAVENPTTWQVESMTYYTYDPSTWTVTKEQVGDKSFSTLTMTWDPEDECVYYAYNSGSSFYLGCMMPDDGQTMQLSKLDSRPVVFATKPDGTLYALIDNGNLVTVDKRTGKYTVIGNTGVGNYSRTSACIDPDANVLYYAFCGERTSAMYAIDLVTAAATKLYDLPQNEEILGLYLAEDNTNPDVPAAPANLALDIEPGALTGNVTFDVPANLYGGSAGSGDVSYEIAIDGSTAASGTAAYGATGVSKTVTFSQSGSYTISVTLTNAAGASPAASLTRYVGADVPSKVTSAKASWSGSAFTISWKAPTEGVNGGWLDTDNLRYRVVCAADNRVVAEATAATSVTDEVTEPRDAVVAYQYKITPVTGALEGETVTTSKVSIGYFVPPYSNDFESSAAITGYVVLDANSDGKKFAYNSSSKALRCQYNSSKAMDDWFFTPQMQMEKGCSYTVSIKARAHNTSDDERVEVAMTTDTKANTVVAKIIEPTDIHGTDWITLSGSFTPTASGRYRVGVHGISDKNKYYLYVTGISVSAGASHSAPAAVSDLTVTPGADGALSAHISFTTPSKGVDGGELSELTKVEIARGETVIKTFDNPATGTKLEYTDTEAPARNNNYTVTAYNAEGAGQAASQNVFVGFAAPAMPADAAVKRGDGAGQAVVSWQPVSTDASGATLSPGSVTYSVLRAVGDETELVAQGLTDTSYTDRALADTDDQQFVAYGVYATTTGGDSKTASTQYLPLGKAYTLPFAESFANGRINSLWGMEASSPTIYWSMGQDLSIDGIDSQDTDNGLAFMQGMYANTSATLYSGAIDIPADGTPWLSLWYYNYKSANTLKVAVSEPGASTADVLGSIELSAAEPEGWVKFSADMAAYKGHTVQLHFIAGCVNTSIFVIDNVLIENRLAHDLTARSISFPARVAPGEEYDVRFSYENIGLETASGYTVELLRDGEQVASLSGADLAPYAGTSVTFPRSMTHEDAATATYAVRINYAADLNTANNTSAAHEILRVTPQWPVPQAPAASVTDGAVTTSWTAPDLTVAAMAPVTDSFDSYPAFSIGLAGSELFDDYLGDWTMVDNDMVSPFNITSGGQLVTFPNWGRPTGFVCFNGPAAGLTTGWEARSGEQMMVSFASGNGPCDDWMISPLLDGSEQTVTFYAKTLSDLWGADSFQFHTSATDMKLSSFTRMESVDEVPEDWTLYTYRLPAGTRYFAIRCVSNATFAFCVDDVTYTPAHPAAGLELLGYNLYRDGIKLNTAPIAGETHTDTEAALGSHSYRVTALYNRGESDKSEEATVVVSAADAPVAAGISIAGGDGAVEVRGASGEEVRVAAADGRIITSVKVNGDTRIPAMPGVYVVTAGSHIAKVMVR